MRNRVKNLFIAGVMLASLGLASVVQVAPVGAISKTAAEGKCKSMGNEAMDSKDGYVYCYMSNPNASACSSAGGQFSDTVCKIPYTESSSNTNIVTSTWVSGSSAEDVAQQCRDKGGKLGSNGIKQVASGFEAECILNSGSGDNDPSDNGGNNGDTLPTEDDIKYTGSGKDGYSYGYGLESKDTLSTSVLDCSDSGNGEGIFCILNIGLTVLTWGVGIAGTLGIVICGIQYLTARDSVDQAMKAKNRLINIIVGLVIYAVMWGFLTWLIPGGLF